MENQVDATQVELRNQIAVTEQKGRLQVTKIKAERAKAVAEAQVIRLRRPIPRWSRPSPGGRDHAAGRSGQPEPRQGAQAAARPSNGPSMSIRSRNDRWMCRRSAICRTESLWWRTRQMRWSATWIEMKPIDRHYQHNSGIQIIVPINDSKNITPTSTYSTH